MVQVQTQYEFIYEYINLWIKEKGYARTSPKTITTNRTPPASLHLDNDNEFE
jgi:hypothetical protein